MFGSQLFITKLWVSPPESWCLFLNQILCLKIGLHRYFAKLKSERILPQFIHFCFYICLCIWHVWCYEYIHHNSPHNPQACHIFRLLPMCLAYFQAKVKSEFAYSRLPRNSQLLWCPDFFTPTSVSLWVSLGPWSYLHLINWVEEEIGLWRRISNTWSSSLFFVFQMHDICKSLISSCTSDRSFASSIYTNTLSHIISWW